MLNKRKAMEKMDNQTEGMSVMDKRAVKDTTDSQSDAAAGWTVTSLQPLVFFLTSFIANSIVSSIVLSCPKFLSRVRGQLKAPDEQDDWEGDERRAGIASIEATGEKEPLAQLFCITTDSRATVHKPLAAWTAGCKNSANWYNRPSPKP